MQKNLLLYINKQVLQVYSLRIRKRRLYFEIMHFKYKRKQHCMYIVFTFVHTTTLVSEQLVNTHVWLLHFKHFNGISAAVFLLY